MRCNRFLNTQRRLLPVLISSFLVLSSTPFIPPTRADREAKVISVPLYPSTPGGELLELFPTGTSGTELTGGPEVSRAVTAGTPQLTSLAGRVTSGSVGNANGALQKQQGRQGNGIGYGDGVNGVTPVPPVLVERGGPGADGSFSTNPPPTRSGAPGKDLPNLDTLRQSKPEAPRAKALSRFQPKVMCADCDGGGGGGGFPTGDPNFSNARHLPGNETGAVGVDLGSRNFNWSTNLLSLPGRAGLDLNLNLTYNSLVWTKDGSYIKFNGDDGSPAPGFKLGLPTVQQRFLNPTLSVYSYMLVSPSGARVELRQIGATSTYESEDGSYTQLIDNSTSLVVRSSDGTQLTFVPMNDVTLHGYRCTQVKDRNGNYISANYDASNGHLLSITDTLGRVISFVYDTNNNLKEITQSWAGNTHIWARFYYTEVWMAPNFGGGLIVNGRNNALQTVLDRVNLHDGSAYTFEYNTAFGQVKKINHLSAATQVLSYTSYNMDASAGQTDCPRFTERRDWADDWNGENETVTTYAVAGDNSWSKVTAPDGTIYKEFFATTGWMSGLTTETKFFANAAAETANTPLKRTTMAWTQDNTGLSYQKNPRPTEVNIYDSANNRRRSTIDYTTFTLPSGASCSLLSDVKEYQSDGVTELRRRHTDYRNDSIFLERRIIGLRGAEYLYEGSTVRAKTFYDYDWPQWSEHLLATPAAAVQHDAANFGAGTAAGRGNLVLMHRWDASDPDNYSKTIENKWGYWTTGAVAFSRDQEHLHQTNISYSDAFSDSVNRNTFAYPTAVTDAENSSTTSQYDFDHGGVKRITTPAPNGGSAPYQSYLYDSAGRLERVTRSVDNSFRRWVYPTDMLSVLTFASILDGTAPESSGEAYGVQVLDGAGRVRYMAAELPGSTGGYSSVHVVYDNVGRVTEQSKPTETNGGLAPTGDDSVWYYTLQAYDALSRPTVTTNSDGTTRENTYSGCGCAGGEVVTVRDEAGRRKRMTMDVVGRLKKTEELDYDQNVYSTTDYVYNVRDQLTSITQQNDRVRTFEYDGFGRLARRITPEQGETNYTYFRDDTVQTITDARGATMTFSYNRRHQVLAIDYGAPSGVAATPNVTFQYDAAGNRTRMDDGPGVINYVYDQASRLTSETRAFDGLGSYALSYQYNLGDQVKQFTNQSGAVVNYNHDEIGRVSSVTGSGYAGGSNYLSSLSYRAFGAAKQINYGNGKQLSLSYNNRMMLTQWNVPGVLGYSYSYNNYLENNTGRVTFATNLTNGASADATLDRSWYYDHVGRLDVAYTGSEARATIGTDTWGHPDGPYAHDYNYDVWGNLTSRAGWGGWNAQYTATFNNKNQMLTNSGNSFGFTYDAAGNNTYDGGPTFTYDALGKQVSATWESLQQSYDGDGLRAKKVQNGAAVYYLRSSVLGGQVVAELDASGGWFRGYVYLGGQLVAVQQAGVTWVHQDPVTKGQRITNGSGNLVSTIELDPFGGDTARSNNASFQSHHFTTYERDTVGGMDEAMARRYHGWWSRFSQPDPYDGSYSLGDPQSLNRYSYVQSDPANFTDPSGLNECLDSQGNWDEGKCGPRIIVDPITTSTWAQGAWGALLDLYFGGRHQPFIQPEPAVGPRLPVDLIVVPQEPNDPDSNAVNTALGVCSTGASIGQYSTVNPAGTAWRGANGQWYRMGWGGNRYTGARSSAIGKASDLGVLSRTTGTVGAGFAFYQSSQSFRQGDYDQGARRVWDAGFGIAGAFGGPVGAAASGAWFGMSTFFDAYPEAARMCKCDAQCRRK